MTGLLSVLAHRAKAISINPDFPLAGLDNNFVGVKEF